MKQMKQQNFAWKIPEDKQATSLEGDLYMVLLKYMLIEFRIDMEKMICVYMHDKMRR